MSLVGIIYSLTIVVSIIIALFLLRLTQLSGRAKAKLEREKKNNLTSEVLDDEALKKLVSDEIKEFIDSGNRRKQATEKVSNIFGKELQKHLNRKSEEVSRKYKTIIEQKTQSEDVAWKRYKKIFDAKKQTETILRSIAEGLVVVDSNGKIIMMNPAAEKLLEFSRKDNIGKSVVDNLTENQLVSLAKDSKDRKSREIEVISQHDETKKILRASSAVIEDENGQTVGMVAVLSDITKQKELDKLKSNFVASVSHELRTPLVAIQKSVSLLLSKAAGKISDVQSKFLSIAERNLKRLSMMIDDLLDFSKFEAGKMKFHPEKASIEPIIDECIETFHTWAGTKSITINKDIQGVLPKVTIDSGKIIQVLTNLIGNAIKFTPTDGKITVEASLAEERNVVEIKVKDTGIGIEKEDLPKVFDKFYQAGERTVTDVSGTGIGLAIVKEIVELHGGQVWVESGKNQGAQFIFTLPL